MENTEQGLILSSFLAKYPFERFLIDSYNRYVLDSLPNYITNNPLEFSVDNEKYKCIL